MNTQIPGKVGFNFETKLCTFKFNKVIFGFGIFSKTCPANLSNLFESCCLFFTSLDVKSDC